MKRNAIVIEQYGNLVQYKDDKGNSEDYDMSYDAGVYDFECTHGSKMTKFGEYLVPGLLRYIRQLGCGVLRNGRGLFTATLFSLAVNSWVLTW